MFQGLLRDHIKFKHEGVGYPCTQCDYKATQQVTSNVPPNPTRPVTGRSLRIHRHFTQKGFEIFVDKESN